MKLPLAMLWLLYSLGISNLSASDARLDRESLRGIKAVCVVVSVPTNYGMNGGQIQADVSERLRSAGISVIGSEPTNRSLPCLFVAANVLKRQDGSWVYEVSVALNQAVTIVANNEAYMAPTWSVSALAISTGAAGTAFISTDVKNLTEKFILAYLSVNQRH